MSYATSKNYIGKRLFWKRIFVTVMLMCIMLGNSAFSAEASQPVSIVSVEAYWVVTASFDSYRNACFFRDELALKGENPVISQAIVNGVLYYRVMTGPWQDRDSADKSISGLKKKGVSGSWVIFTSPDFGISAPLASRSGELRRVPNDVLSTSLERRDTEMDFSLIQSGGEPDVRVGVAITNSSKSHIKLGSDVLIEVSGKCGDESISLEGSTISISTGSDPDIIVCTIDGESPAEFRGIVEVSIDHRYKDKFIWLNDVSKIYRGKFEITRNESGGITVVNEVKVEDYICSVLEAEMGLSSPFEALCAQAVAIRTNVLSESPRHEAEGYDFCATTHCQVYSGAAGEHREPLLRDVIEETRGEVLFYEGEQVKSANFFAACGGITESAAAIWGSDVPYLQSMICSCYGGPFLGDLRDEADIAGFLKFEDPNYMCSTHKGYRWSVNYSRSELEKILSPLVKKNANGVCNDPGKLIGIDVTERTLRGTAMCINVKMENFSFDIRGEYNIRVALGGTGVVRSALFIMEFGKESVKITGAGFGHGVGMCQSGARELARQGFDYKEILSRYYAGVVVQKIVY